MTFENKAYFNIYFCYATGDETLFEKTINMVIKAGENIHLLLIYIKKIKIKVLNCIVDKKTKKYEKSSLLL